eukprot:UN17272
MTRKCVKNFLSHLKSKQCIKKRKKPETSKEQIASKLDRVILVFFKML